jgi:uncharacterized protein
MASAVRDNAALSRFELDFDDGMAFMEYRLAGDVIMLNHTETPLQARGRGIASQLVEGALEIARARGLTIVPRCPFVRAYVDKHPQFQDLVVQQA